MNDPQTENVRPGPVRSGSATARQLPGDGRSTGSPAPNAVTGDATHSDQPGVLDWVPRGAELRGGDYPIEGGVPHPRWVPGPAEHRLGASRVVIAESATVVRLLIALAVAAFLLGLSVFYPVSPLGQ